MEKILDWADDNPGKAGVVASIAVVLAVRVAMTNPDPLRCLRQMLSGFEWRALRELERANSKAGQ